MKCSPFHDIPDPSCAVLGHCDHFFAVRSQRNGIYAARVPTGFIPLTPPLKHVYLFLFIEVPYSDRAVKQQDCSNAAILQRTMNPIFSTEWRHLQLFMTAIVCLCGDANPHHAEY